MKQQQTSPTAVILLAVAVIAVIALVKFSRYL